MNNKQITARLNELNAEIDRYKAKARRLGIDAQTEGRSVVDNLVEQRDALARKLDEYSKSSGAAMERIGAGLQESLEALNRSVKDAARMFKD